MMQFYEMRIPYQVLLDLVSSDSVLVIFQDKIYLMQDYLTFNFKCLVQGIKKGIYNSKGAEYWIDTTFKINTKVD